jgi:hypothetical protein
VAAGLVPTVAVNRRFDAVGAGVFAEGPAVVRRDRLSTFVGRLEEGGRA